MASCTGEANAVKNILTRLMVISMIYGAVMVPVGQFLRHNQEETLIAWAVFCFSSGALALGKGWLGRRSFFADPDTSEGRDEMVWNAGHWIAGLLICLVLWPATHSLAIALSTMAGMIIGSLIFPPVNQPGRIDDYKMTGTYDRYKD